MVLTVEELNSKRHRRADFSCGVDALDYYLKALATQHRTKGVATSFVLIDSAEPARILGYYSLSAASLRFSQLSEADRKGLPAYPVPAARIGRLAVSTAARSRGLGELLLQNAIKRVLTARSTLGVLAVVVEAKDDIATAFYRKYGFRSCDLESRQMYLPLGTE